MIAEPPQDGRDSEDAPTRSTRPGLSTFTIEGRAAPGLFVVGWLATILGAGIALVGVLGNSRPIYFGGFILLALGLLAGAGNQAIERRARGESYAGPSPFLVIVAIFASVIAVGFLVGVGLDLAGVRSMPAYLKILIGVSLQAVVFFGVIRLTVVGTGALSWSEMGWTRPDLRAAAHFASGAAVAVPIVGLTLILAALLVRILGVQPTSPLPATGQPIGLLVNLIAGSVLAPLYEEATFRGFAITAWGRTMGYRSALIRAALVFALAHVIDIGGDQAGEAFGLALVAFATRLPVAFALGWLFLSRRSIWAPIGLHVAFNAIQIVLAEAVRVNGPS